ncbi:MBL fold metallo-hydrolase [Desulfobacula sp.]|uniref:MBL fold metallo-hydrolase n=1 Tax=Desulfobacula sp. TaxID=2593537 RepID=UPI00262245D0|nr:MBL fold metallo-hydrolase [Desulfobacula sp.]
MKIQYFGYNSFLIKSGKSKIAVDPGQNMWVFKFNSLIPKAEWNDITHIAITHGDPDHYWQADRITLASNATLILNKTMIKQSEKSLKLLRPRSHYLKFDAFNGTVFPLGIGETIDFNDFTVRGIPTLHGTINMSIWAMKLQISPGPGKRFGFGSIGFEIRIENKIIVNLGDSLFLNEWKNLNPDILMIPIGGLGNNTLVMDANEALTAIKIIAPKIVIPCHYNIPFFFNKRMLSVDEEFFKLKVERLGIKCNIMQSGDEFEI